MDDAVTRYCDASSAGDIERLMETVSPDVELVSPISGRMVFRGERDVRLLLTAVYGSLRGLRWTEELGDGGTRIALGDARVLGVRITDAMVFELAPDGRIARIRHVHDTVALRAPAER